MSTFFFTRKAPISSAAPAMPQRPLKYKAILPSVQRSAGGVGGIVIQREKVRPDVVQEGPEEHTFALGEPPAPYTPLQLSFDERKREYQDLRTAKRYPVRKMNHFFREAQEHVGHYRRFLQFLKNLAQKGIESSADINAIMHKWWEKITKTKAVTGASMEIGRDEICVILISPAPNPFLLFPLWRHERTHQKSCIAAYNTIYKEKRKDLEVGTAMRAARIATSDLYEDAKVILRDEILAYTDVSSDIERELETFKRMQSQSPSRGKPLQRQAVGAIGNTATRVAEVLRSPGWPLDEGTRRFFEKGFGHDFSKVRVHSDESAARSASALNATAYTVGKDIVFGKGRFSPGSETGRRLLAHELTHVVQQEAARATAPNAARYRVVEDRGGEAEADRMAEAVVPAGGKQPAHGSLSKEVRAAGSVGVQRQSLRGDVTYDAVTFYFHNISLERDPGLVSALKLLKKFEPIVPLASVSFEALTSTASLLDPVGRRVGGRAFWRGNKPVIELPLEYWQTMEAHVEKRAAVADVYSVIQTVVHELNHLWRQRTGNKENPVHAAFQKEAQIRLQRVRENWFKAIGDGGAIRGLPHLPRPVKKWSDLPEQMRNKIEEEASETDYIQGLYARSSYIVEEIYSVIEELEVIRTQALDESSGGAPKGYEKLNREAKNIYYLHNRMVGQAGAGEVLTPSAVQQSKAAILRYLRKQYRPRHKGERESYEVRFYLSAIRTGKAPLEAEGGSAESLLTE